MRTATCHTPYGDLTLSRYPTRRRESLRAWNSADLLLLEEASKLDLKSAQTLVVNDSHGVLSVALRPRALWTDSALSVSALRANEARAGIAATSVCWSTEPPPKVQSVVMRIPKQLAYLEYQLAQLAKIMPENGILLAAGMDKHLSRQTATIIERYIGPTERHRGSRKARLFSALRGPGTAVATDTAVVSYTCQETGLEFESLPNVFSRNTLDAGASLLVSHLSQLGPAERVVDLACGNGVLGLTAYHQKLTDRVVFCDESALAIESARRNAKRLFQWSAGSFQFSQSDGLQGINRASVEPGERGDSNLLICNPPFHLEHTVDAFVGQRLIRQAGQFLRGGDRLLLVANRHLGYEDDLNQACRNVRKIAANSKFKLFLAGNEAL